MDKKKALRTVLLFLGMMVILGFDVKAQTPRPNNLQFCDRTYSYEIGNDTIRIYFNITDTDGKRISNIPTEEFNVLYSFYEDGKQINNGTVKRLSTGIRIPKEYTFSILLDRSIPTEGKQQILNSIKHFVSIAPDSSVYVSFYGDEVSNTIPASIKNFSEIEQNFLKPSDAKYFYSGVHSKLAEFSKHNPSFMSDIQASDYKRNNLISSRAAMNPEKNYLLVFAEGSKRPDDEMLDFVTLTDYQANNIKDLPKVYGFYYTADGEDNYINTTLQGLTQPKDSTRTVIRNLLGKISSSANMNDVVKSFQTVIQDATYDYEFLYRAQPDKVYSGNIEYAANWGNSKIGETKFTIGSAERPWPEKEQSTTSFIIELLVAILVTIITFVFFFFIMKVVVPYIQSLTFKSKYYKKYQQEENVQRRICHYCKQDIRPGQIIVTKCNHWMHKHCWEENGYKCAEFGQNCKTGIQNHVEWKDLFKMSSLKDCSQTIAGVLAGLVSWIIYEICGRGGFTGLSKLIVGIVFNADDPHGSLINECVSRTSSFLTRWLN